MPENIVITAELKDLVSGHLKDITTQMDRLEGSLANVNKTQSAGGSGGGLMGSFLGANLLTQGIGMATSAIKDFAASSVSAYMANEMYESRLTTLLHSREQALSALSQITKDAALTPFDKQSLVQGNSMLIGAGESASGARKSIMDLGNAIAATGGGSDELSRMSVNLAQIKSIGKASALDVKQFMYANIPIYDMLSKSMGKNVKEIKEMDISYKDLTKALSDARQEGGMFYQGLENANQTLSGQVSNLGDSWDQLKTSIAASQSGILKNTVSWANDMVSQMNKAFSVSNFMNKATEGLGKSAFGGAGFGYKTNLIDDRHTKAGDITGSQRLDAFAQKIMKISEGANAEDVQNKKNEITQIFRDIRAEYNQSGKKTMSTEFYNSQLAILGKASKDLNLIAGAEKASKVDKELGSGAGPKASDLEAVAKGNRPTQVNINIENLVREYKPQVADNGKEVYKVTQEDVAKALLAAVNDASVMKFGS